MLSMPSEICPAALADRQTKNHERAHRDKLRPGCYILQGSALPQAHDVHPGDEDDREDSRDVGPGERDARGRKNHVLFGNCREDRAQISSGRDRQCGNRSAVCHRKQHPAIQESDQVSEGFTQVDVLSARVWKHRAQFGECEGRAHRDQRAHYPHQHEQGWVRERARDIFCSQENRRSDNPARQQQHRIEQRESAH